VEWLPLRGRLPGGGSLLIDGRPATLIDDTFEETITLGQGPNAIELVATDLVGNVSVEKFDVFLDQEPPQLVRQQASPSRAAPGDPAGRRRDLVRFSALQSIQRNLSVYLRRIRGHARASCPERSRA
jgi:hypothetical protein